jgi:hypothetical protein
MSFAGEHQVPLAPHPPRDLDHRNDEDRPARAEATRGRILARREARWFVTRNLRSAAPAPWYPAKEVLLIRSERSMAAAGVPVP